MKISGNDYQIKNVCVHKYITVCFIKTCLCPNLNVHTRVETILNMYDRLDVDTMIYFVPFNN